MDLQKFYVTFGVQTLFRNNYLILMAEDEEKAREALFESLGHYWSSIYSKEEWEASIVSKDYFEGYTSLGTFTQRGVQVVRN